MPWLCCVGGGDFGLKERGAVGLGEDTGLGGKHFGVYWRPSLKVTLGSDNYEPSGIELYGKERERREERGKNAT